MQKCKALIVQPLSELYRFFNQMGKNLSSPDSFIGLCFAGQQALMVPTASASLVYTIPY